MPKSSVPATPVNTAAPKKAQKKQAEEAAKKLPAIEKREIVYEKVAAKLYVGEKAMTAEEAKKLIGWDDENVTDANYTLTDHNDKKVRLWNNPRNRPFDKLQAKLYESEILNPGRDENGNPTRTRWKCNGETMIIGRTGVTISAQHRLVALILAAQEWAKNRDQWPNWTTEPTLECIVIFGIAEDDSTVNTIDTGKQRSFSDVVFRSEFFATRPAAERQKIAGILSGAVKLVGYRSNAFKDAYSVRRTHSDLLDFLYRHETHFINAVKHIYEENASGKISKFIAPGVAAGLLFLMGCSQSDPKKYRDADSPTEEALNWELWDTACNFWVQIAAGSKEIAAVRTVLGELFNAESGNDVSVPVKCALIAKAWQCVAAGQPITPKSIKLEFSTDEDGVQQLMENPTVGGIDLGNPKDDGEDTTPSVAEIEQRKIEERAKKESAGETPKPFAGKSGTKVHVADPQAKSDWDGVLVKIVNGTAHVKDENGAVYEVPATCLTKA